MAVSLSAWSIGFRRGQVPVAYEDCWDALVWVSGQALGVDEQMLVTSD